MKIRPIRHVLICAGVFGFCGSAAAQPAAEGWQINLGAGGLYAPTYEGDDDYRLSLLPNVQIAYGERFFASIQDGLGYRVVNSDAFSVGPIARLRFGRDDDGSQAFAVSGEDTNDLRGLGDVDASVELGGFAEYTMGPVELSLEARQAINGHDGLVADLGARWSGRADLFGGAQSWSIGPRVRFVDDAYTTAYFGVSPSQSAASGLPVYHAGGGLHSYGVGASVVWPFGERNRWAAVLVAGYDRLEGDAADSPLVQQRGSEDQASIGLFLSRRL